MKLERKLRLSQFTFINNSKHFFFQDYQRLVKENEDQKDRICQDEKTLEELAAKLSNAKLEIDSLREKTSVLNSWLDDSDVHDCPLCGKDFGLSRRKVSFHSCFAQLCYYSSLLSKPDLASVQNHLETNSTRPSQAKYPPLTTKAFLATCIL